MPELLDIIDEHGMPTGESKPRPEIHAGNFWHSVVHVYVFRKGRSGGIELLCHLRSKTKDHNPDRWDTRFGGHVKEGETIEQTALTEPFEEIGLEVDPVKLIKGPVKSFAWPQNRERVSVYYYPFDGEITALSFNDGEVQKVEWIGIDEILQEKKSTEKWTGGVEGFVEIVNDLKSKLCIL